MISLRLGSLLLLIALGSSACQIGKSFNAMPVDFITLTRLNHRQGPLQSTGQATDWAIDGPGFFEVLNRETGRTYYTRNGALQLNQNRELVTAEGYLFQPAMTLPLAHDTFLSEGGTVWAQDNQTQQWIQMGAITLARFARPEKLVALGGRGGYYQATDAAGQLEVGQVAQNGFGMTLSGVLEDFSVPPAPTPELGCQEPQAQQATARALDWAIEGDGYFSFISPLTGERFLTRQASIRVNSHGQLVSPHGYFLDPAITLPPVNDADLAAGFVRIDADGTVWALTPVDDEPIPLGLVTLVQVKEPTALQPLGFSRPNVFAAPRQMGQTQNRFPGKGVGTVRGGYLETCGQELISRPESFLKQVVSGGL